MAMTTSVGGEQALERPAPQPAAPGSLAADLFSLYVQPSDLFARLPRWNRSAPALLLLLLLHALFGLALASTRVLDYEIDRRTQRVLGRQADLPPTDAAADELNRTLDGIEKAGVFAKMLARVQLVAGGPLRVLVGVGVLAGLLFVVVAFAGRAKPDFSLLAGLAVFAAYVEVPQLLLRLWLVAQLQASRVEATAAAFAVGPQVGLGAYLLLRRLDPFAAWYWCLIGLGLWKTGQLSGRLSVCVTVALALLSALVQCCLDLPELADFGTAP
jgi:hypothetical protein